MSRNTLMTDAVVLLRKHLANLHEDLEAKFSDEVTVRDMRGAQRELEHMVYLLKTLLPQETNP